MAKKVQKKVETETTTEEPKVGKSTTDAQDIAALREKYEAMAKDMPHREYGMALNAVAKALKLVESNLKVVDHVEADIKKRAEKAEKAKAEKEA